MVPSKLLQLQYETCTWKNSLDFMMEENIRMKNRVSEVLKAAFDKKHLEKIDIFQNRFIKADELIYILRNDLAHITATLKKESYVSTIVSNAILQHLHLLRYNIVSAEESFGKLKSEFNTYLSENI